MKPIVPLSALVTSLLCLAPLSAQHVYNSGSSASTGSNNVIPFGHSARSTTWSNQKYQTIMLKTAMPKTPGIICSLGVSSSSVTGTKEFDTIEIIMGYLPGKGSAMTTTFANNLGKNSVTVLKATNYTFNIKRDAWTHIGLQKPFLYLPALGHLVIQVTVTGAHGTASHLRAAANPGAANQPRLYAFGNSWSAGKPPANGSLGSSHAIRMQLGYGMSALDKFGKGCQGSNKQTPDLVAGGSAKFGGTMTLNLKGALAKAPMFMSAYPSR